MSRALAYSPGGLRGIFLYTLSPQLPSNLSLSNGLQRWLLYAETDDGAGVHQFIEHLGISEPTSRASIHEFLHLVLEQMRHLVLDQVRNPEAHQGVTIDGIIEAICRSKGAEVPNSSPSTLATARQAVFSTVGRLTLFFRWKLSPRPDGFAITATGNIQPANSGSRRSIGKLLQSIGQSNWPAHEPRSQLLVASNLDFFTLSVVTKIKLEFIHDIASHLSLNPVTRRLCIFAHPAFCAFWCDPQVDWTLLDSLHDLHEENSRDIFRLHFQEILLSLRLLFAGNAKSRDLFFREYTDQLAPAGREDLRFWESLLAVQGSRAVAALPPFYWPPPVVENERITDQDAYDMSCDFTIIGTRLERLQTYCLKHNPRKLRDMWYDRRNRQQWVTFWAAIIIGGTSVLLSLIQAIIGGLQLRAAQNETGGS